MAAETPLFSLSFTAENDLSGDQFKFVELSGDMQVDTCDAATDQPIGVLQNKPAAGETADVMISGRTKIEAGEALTAGDLIGPAADGQADIKVAGTDTAEFVAGQVVEGASAAGNIGSAIIDCSNVGRAA